MKSLNIAGLGLIEMTNIQMHQINGGQYIQPSVDKNSFFYKLGEAIGKTAGEIVGGVLLAGKALIDSGALSVM